jgi:hypothetical protein
LIDLVKKIVNNKLSNEVFIEDLKVLPTEEGVTISCEVVTNKGKSKILKATISKAEILKAVEDTMANILKEKLEIKHD